MKILNPFYYLCQGKPTFVYINDVLKIEAFNGRDGTEDHGGDGYSGGGAPGPNYGGHNGSDGEDDSHGYEVK